jgi:hypothetical protein
VSLEVMRVSKRDATRRVASGAARAWEMFLANEGVVLRDLELDVSHRVAKASVVMERAGLRGKQTIYKKIVDEMSGGECMLDGFKLLYQNRE